MLRIISGLSLSGVVMLACAAPSGAATREFAYRSPALESIIAESSVACGTQPSDFPNFWTEKMILETGQNPQDWVAMTRLRLDAAPDLTERQLEVCQELHALIKRALPRFSLDLGFEFANAPQGYRQCLLQSVLISSLLQSAGMDAGVAMVWKNERGEESNCGHVVSLVRLSNGHMVLCDASSAQPFVGHQGLLVAKTDGHYEFVLPHYEGAEQISGFQPAEGGTAMAPTQFQPLDLAFVRSQFCFYRGERAPGGLLADAPTRKGLEASAEWLRKSVALCDRNPLAVYSLGRALSRAGEKDEARRWFERSVRLYTEYGWLPASVRRAAR